MLWLMCFGPVGFEKSEKRTSPVYQRSKKREKQATMFHRASMPLIHL